MISKRTQAIDSSGIRRVFDLARTLKNPINLSIGQPDFDVSNDIKEAAKAAIDDGYNGYTPTQGIEELLAGVRRKYDLPVDGSSQQWGEMITSGVSGGLMLSYMAILDPGDEILVPDPCFCIYPDLASLVNATAVYYDTYPDFSVSAEVIERHITDKTRAIIVNSPSNPTGYTIRQDDLNSIVELAKEKNIWLIYDEIYESYSYEDAHAKCFGNYEYTVVLNGFSKSHAVTGWRIGYAVGPRDIIEEMLKIQQYTFVCAPSIVQHAMIPAMKDKRLLHLDEYRVKRDFVVNALSEHFNMVAPRGAFYVFPEAPGGSGEEFIKRCVEEKNLLAVPGHVFSQRDSHFRISFAVPMATLEKGIDALVELAIKMG